MRKTSKRQVSFKAGIPSVFEVQVMTEVEGENNDDNAIYYGYPISIRVCDGTYWQVNRSNENRVMALAKHIKEWETLEIVAADDEFVSDKNRIVRYGDQVAFRFVTNGCFVGADLRSPRNALTANVPWVKEWEVFTLTEHPQKQVPRDRKVRYGSWFALRACNAEYVMFDRDNTKQLLACAPHIDEWEAFVFIRPSEPK